MISLVQKWLNRLYLAQTTAKAGNISTYDKQITAVEISAIRRSAKRFLLNFNNYTESAERNAAYQLDANRLKTKTKFAADYCNSSALNKKTRIPNLLLPVTALQIS